MNFSGKLVERGNEQKSIRAALDEAMAGRGKLLLVGGEAGMGKTRLALNFADRAHRTANLLGQLFLRQIHLSAATFEPLTKGHIDSHRTLRFILR